MSKTHFYHQVIEIESLIVELDKLELSADEKAHLASLIDSSLHHTVLDAVLSELPEQDKKVFLKHLETNDHPKIWTHLNDKVDNIEEKIKKAADELKTELHKDLKEAKQVK
jgi:Mg/Co/Ni transporter MgtE